MSPLTLHGSPGWWAVADHSINDDADSPGAIVMSVAVCGQFG
jgi:hypothetical protein